MARAAPPPVGQPPGPGAVPVRSAGGPEGAAAHRPIPVGAPLSTTRRPSSSAGSSLRPSSRSDPSLRLPSSFPATTAGEPVGPAGGRRICSPSTGGAASARRGPPGVGAVEPPPVRHRGIIRSGGRATATATPFKRRRYGGRWCAVASTTPILEVEQSLDRRGPGLGRALALVDAKSTLAGRVRTRHVDATRAGVSSRRAAIAPTSARPPDRRPLLPAPPRGDADGAAGQLAVLLPHAGAGGAAREASSACCSWWPSAAATSRWRCRRSRASASAAGLRRLTAAATAIHGRQPRRARRRPHRGRARRRSAPPSTRWPGPSAR